MPAATTHPIWSHLAACLRRLPVAKPRRTACRSSNAGVTSHAASAQSTAAVRSTDDHAQGSQFPHHRLTMSPRNTTTVSEASQQPRRKTRMTWIGISESGSSSSRAVCSAAAIRPLARQSSFAETPER